MSLYVAWLAAYVWLAGCIKVVELAWRLAGYVMWLAGYVALWAAWLAAYGWLAALRLPSWLGGWLAM